ncbi:hypothetical protein GOODEAATRI_009105, partial [Goodea atripinnis]
YWSITVYGRKHCYRLYTKHFNEAVHWACAIQKIIDTKSPVETPTQLLIRDIEENKFNPEVVEHIYQHNTILKYTQGPLHAPLLPFPYGNLEHTYHNGKGYGSVREEAVKLFNCLQQLELAREPVPIIQGVLQTCLDLRPLRDEVYCQLVKQTSHTPSPNTAAHLRYWQLLTCMSCTFLPGSTVLKYLRFHLKRANVTSGQELVAGEGEEPAMQNRFGWEVHLMFVPPPLFYTIKCTQSLTYLSWTLHREEAAGHWSLAALRLQSLMGDFSTHAPFPPLDELFPGHMLETRVLMSLSAPQAAPPCQVAAQDCPAMQRFPTGLLAGTLWSHSATVAHKQKMENDMRLRSRLKEEAAAVMTAILERWKGLAGYSSRDSMAAYLTIARQWSGFGSTLYEVDFYIVSIFGGLEVLFTWKCCLPLLLIVSFCLQSSTGNFSQKLWLGVAATSVSIYKQGESEALESFPYGQICSYGVSDSNTFKITAGDRDLIFETSKLMNAYFSAIHRQRGKGEDPDTITFTESTDVGFRHMSSTPTPTLLELPSHPV